MGHPSGMDGMAKAWHGQGCAGVQCTVSPAARWSTNPRGTGTALCISWTDDLQRRSFDRRAQFHTRYFVLTWKGTRR